MKDDLKPGQMFRHIKRGTEYEIIGVGDLQMSRDLLVDGSSMVLYRGANGQLCCREEGEFLDGRFERVNRPEPVADEALVERIADVVENLGYEVADSYDIARAILPIIREHLK